MNPLQYAQLMVQAMERELEDLQSENMDTGAFEATRLWTNIWGTPAMYTNIFFLNLHGSWA